MRNKLKIELSDKTFELDFMDSFDNKEFDYLIKKWFKFFYNKKNIKSQKLTDRTNIFIENVSIKQTKENDIAVYVNLDKARMCEVK